MQKITKNYDVNDIYTDLDLDLPIHPLTGNVNIAKGIKAVNKSLKNLIYTAKWDMPFDPHLYCGVNEMIFESASPVYFNHMETKITDLITNHEPRVKVMDVNIVHTSTQAITITISYEIIAIDMMVETSIILKRDR